MTGTGGHRASPLRLDSFHEIGDQAFERVLASGDFPPFGVLPFTLQPLLAEQGSASGLIDNLDIEDNDEPSARRGRLPSIGAADTGPPVNAMKKPITVKFEIPYFTVSGVQVRYLKIMEKSGYQALPWVRYITQNGDYHIRTS
jgi:hypothetical protein